MVGWASGMPLLWLRAKLTYGFSAIAPDPDLLEKSFQDLYYKILPPLRVNCKIAKFFRMAPRRYFGLAMPNPGIVMLSHKLQLLHTQWDMPTTTGQMLRQSFEVFQMEVGLSSNILSEDYDRLGNLASGGWWKQLWCLCHKYNVLLSFASKYLIPLLRVGDRPIMAVICCMDLYTALDREIINRVRKFKGLHSMGDLVLCDGRTVDPFALSREPSDSSRVFSVEKPTRSDFALFRQAILNITSHSLRLSPSLGPFIAQPHRPDVWFVSPCSQFLYHDKGDSSYIRYSCLSSRPTRFGTKFGRPEHRSGLFPTTHRASVQVRSPDCVVLHSSAKVYVPSPVRRSFMQRLRALPNQSLWRTLKISGDGSWIYNGLMRGTLIMVSDGSYNDRIARDVCSCAAILHCKETQNRASVTWVERTSTQCATNFRAEILGSIAIQLLLSVALDGKYVSPSCRPRVGCDNKGVVFHGNHPHRPLASTQRQADLLRYFKKLVAASRAKIKMFHVYGHMDRFLSANERSDEENVNVDCDALAETALSDGVLSGEFIDLILPDEDIVALVDETKITGNATPQILRHWGDSVARAHYVSQGILTDHSFDCVDWDGAEEVLDRSPEMFGVWAAKQTSGTCGVNHILRHFVPGTVDECPNCGTSPERATHLYVCSDRHRTAVFHSSVTALSDWLVEQRTDGELVMLIVQYLRSRGKRTMLSFCSLYSRYRGLAAMQDSIGFRNFLEGRIATLFRHHRQQDISRRHLRKHTGHWVKGLILQLLQVSHRQRGLTGMARYI